MTTPIGSTTIEVRADVKNFDRDVVAQADSAGKKASSTFSATLRGSAIGTAVGNLAANGLAGAASAIKDFATGSVAQFAAVEDATGAAGVQFGNALPSVLRFSEEALGAFGLSKRAALDAQNSFGTLGKSAGLAGEPLAQFAGDLTGLAGDLASFKGTTTEQAIEAVGAALRGEAEPIRAYGVLLDDATLRQEALALGLIKTTKDALTPQQKVLAAQSAILKQTSDAQGDFARTSDSTANTQKRLEAATENASAKLGEKLAPIVTAVRQKFLDLITALTDTEGGFQQKVVPAAQAVGGAISAVTEFVGDNQTAFQALGAVIVTLTAITLTYSAVLAVQAAGGLLAFLKATKLVTAATKVYTAVQAALNLVLLLNPIALVVVAIAALVAGIVIAYKNSETFRTIVQAVFKAVAKAVLGAVDAILGAIEGVFRALSKLPGVGDQFGRIADSIAGARGKVDALGRAINGLPSSRTIVITTVTRQVTEGARDRNASRRGTVPGQAGLSTFGSVGGGSLETFETSTVDTDPVVETLLRIEARIGSLVRDYQTMSRQGQAATV